MTRHGLNRSTTFCLARRTFLVFFATSDRNLELFSLEDRVYLGLSALLSTLHSTRGVEIKRCRDDVSASFAPRMRFVKNMAACCKGRGSMNNRAKTALSLSLSISLSLSLSLSVSRSRPIIAVIRCILFPIKCRRMDGRVVVLR